MKSILHFLFSIFVLVCALSAAATPLQFSALQMTGATNDITLNIQPVNNPVIFNGNFYWLPPGGTNLTTTNGVGYLSLIPGKYNVYIIGLMQSWQMNVTNSATLVNAANLPSTLTFYSGVQNLTGINGINVTSGFPGNLAIDGSGLDPAGTAWATFSYNATNGIYAFNLASSYGLPAAGVVGLGSAALVSTNTFYNQGVSGYLDTLYNLAQGQVGWLVVSNLSSIQDVPPLLDYLWTAGNNTASLATFAAVSTNQITVYGAGTASANGTYTFNAASGVWTNAATADTITNSGAYLIIATGATKLYKSSNALAYPAGSGAWFNGSGYSGSSPMPYNAFLRVTDYSLNNVAPTNIPGKALTGLATNTVVPISAHVTNGLVTWTSP